MRRVLSIATLLTAFLLIYLPDLGHGFIKDDFAWISRAREARDVWGTARFFATNVGFYRPIVMESFWIDHAVHGLNPFGYGLTNLATLLLACGSLFILARALGLHADASMLAVAVWAFNFHAVNMAVLWISGRTALLMCLFALTALTAFLRGRWLMAGGLCFVAMLSKEEAVCLPMLFTVVALSDRERSGVAARVWPAWAALAAYAILRLQSGAFGSTSAPEYYQFTSDPSLLLRNVFEYLDRGATVAVGVCLLIAMVAPFPARMLTAYRPAISLAVAWFLGFYAITLFLPVRSDLYALAPSAGSAIIAGCFADCARQMHPRRFRAVATALVLVTLAAVPVFRARNQRWVRPADLTSNVLRTIANQTLAEPPREIVLIDDPNARTTLASGFGSLLPDAIRLVKGDEWHGTIREGRDSVSDQELTFALAGNGLRRLL